MTGNPTVRAAEEEITEALEKYGTPPEVPRRLKLRVPLVVTGDPVTVNIPDGEVPLTVRPTLATPPPPPPAFTHPVLI
jgi:hypothetical protein